MELNLSGPKLKFNVLNCYNKAYLSIIKSKIHDIFLFIISYILITGYCDRGTCARYHALKGDGQPKILLKC